MTQPRLEATGSTPEERFRSLFARHYPAVYRYAGRRLGPDEAADAAAEAFTVAWRKIGHVPSEPDTLPWLYGVTRRVVANAERGRRRRRRLVARAVEGGPDPQERAADPVGLLTALAGLAADDREVLRLAAWEGLGPREMGAVLGCSPNAAAIRLHRARRRLERAMNDTGDEL
ncbi:MAG TPA: sigma-70 family RNA polymerase sigma factor [Acidimicrobiia bacterium]|nr:sigma-70 family RNA polymerase sigma factor [Acidimicrobiia bacterium]